MRKLLLPLLFFVLAGFAIRTPVNSEPTPSVRWLMNESASLFDLGMIRMRLSNDREWAPKLLARIKELKICNEVSLEHTGVVYNLDDNIINIAVSLVSKPKESVCADILKEYKEVIMPLLKDYRYEKIRGKHERANDKKDFIEMLPGSYFGHVNYQRGDTPKDLDKNIVQIMEFTVGIAEPDTAEWSGEKIFCKSKLFDDTPTFIKFQRRKK